MKLYKYALSLAVAATAAAMVSCDDDFDRPPVIVPEATIEANTAIEELNQMFWSVIQDNKYTEIPVNENGDSIVIAGTVISSDQSGNVFNGLYIRDESGCTYFRVNAYDIYQSYQPGQEVRINVTGLLIGGYGKAPQLGTLYNNTVGKIADAEFSQRAQVNGLPVKGAADPVSVTIPELNGFKNNEADLQKWIYQLVKIDGLTFEDGGVKAWCDKPGENGSTSRNLVDAAGNKIIAYTNNKSKFASDILPKGTGSVTAILSYFNGKWQLLIMNLDTDLEGFEFVDTPDTPDTPVNPGEAIFSETFKSGIGNFTINNVNAPAAVPQVWKHDAKYGYMIATAYVSSDKSNHAAESWLISPAIDLAGQTAAYLSFDQALNYFTSIDVAKTQATVHVREAGAADWTALTVPSYPAAMGWDFANSGSIDLSAYAGKKIEIGFRYTSTDAKAGTWEVKNVTVTPTGTSTPDVPDTPVNPDTPTGDLYSALGENAASIDWSYEGNSVEGVDAVWTWKEYQSKHYLNASAYISATKTAVASTAYAFSPVVDLTKATKATMTFDHAAKFQTTLRSLCCVVVREEGASAWTEISIPQWPEAGSWTFVTSGSIDLSAYAGKKIQVGFKYGSTAEGADTWEIKNLTIK